MGKGVTISEYHHGRLKAFVKTRIRKSIASIVEEALSKYYVQLDRELSSWEDFKETHQEEAIEDE